MTTPSSSGQELPADGLPPASGRRRRAKPQKRADFRTQAAEDQIAPSRALSRDEAQVRARWTGTCGRCELVVQRVDANVQVRQRTWLATGTVLDEVFLLHSLAEFDLWHAASPTRFDHPVAHDEIRRLAHASLSAPSPGTAHVGPVSHGRG